MILKTLFATVALGMSLGLSAVPAVADGGGNSVTLDQWGSQNGVGIDQDGYRNRLSVIQDGYRNTTVATQDAARNRTAIGQTGSYNTAGTCTKTNYQSPFSPRTSQARRV